MTRLLVLWLLSERSSYGYEIKKALSDDAMRFWFSLEDASIYSALRTMEKHGLVRKVGVEQAGARPKRTRYEITSEGRRRYKELLEDALATPVLPVAPIDVALAARGDLDTATTTAALARRAQALTASADTMATIAAGTPNQAIVDRNAAIVEAEQAWLAQLDPSTVT